MTRAAGLRLVDTASGEVVSEEGLHTRLAELQDQLDGAEREVRAWRARYAALRRDTEAEAREHKNWPVALRLFDLWRELCRHPNSRWTVDRFYAVEPYIAKYGQALCEKAIRGIAYDPWVTRRKNGTEKRHDGWDLCFRNADKFEEHANRAPREPPPDAP